MKQLASFLNIVVFITVANVFILLIPVLSALGAPWGLPWLVFSVLYVTPMIGIFVWIMYLLGMNKSNP